MKIITQKSIGLTIIAAAAVSCGLLREPKDGISDSSRDSGLQAWSSGGGGVVMSGQNPWFLAKNTLEVTYCIKIDENNFGITADQANKSIEEAFDFWNEAFKESGVLALPSFTRTGCDIDIEPSITFLLGVLTEKQFAFLGDPKKYIASTIRTNYDEVNLRGTGFIYVSPQSGPLAPDANHINLQRWEDGPILKMVVMHELGHVLGFGHSHPSMLMNELFPEDVSSKNVALALNYSPDIFSFSTYNSEQCHTPESKQLAFEIEFFGIPKSHLCRKVDVTVSGFSVSSKPTRDDRQWESVGVATFDEQHIIDMTQSLSIFLSQKQQVFTLEEMMPGRNMLGPWIYTTAKIGNYISSNSDITRSVSTEMTLNRATITAIYDGRIVPDVLDYRR